MLGQQRKHTTAADKPQAERADFGPCRFDGRSRFKCRTIFAGRDRPLRFHHRIDEPALESLGLPKPKNEHRKIARASILAEAILAQDEGKAVSYSRRRQSYTGRQRYMGPAYTYSNVISAIDVLCTAGLLEEQRAKSGSREWQSTFCAKTALLSMRSRESSVIGDFTFHIFDPIRLRDKLPDGSSLLIDYRDAAQTRAMRREIEGINADYSSLILDLPCVQKTDHHWIVEKSIIRPTPLFLYRVFNRGSWSCGGRAYAWWQQLPKCFRAQLLINDEQVAEPDYSALHAALIYAERGVPLSGDPYELDGFERGQCKLAFLIAVNSKSARDATASLVRRHGMDRAVATKIMHALTAKHSRVSDAFCSDAGIRLMRQDSDLILASTRACLDAGIAALPVHDSLIVPRRSEQTAAAILIENFERRFPKASPCTVTTNAGKVSQMPSLPSLPSLPSFSRESGECESLTTTQRDVGPDSDQRIVRARTADRAGL